MRGGNGDNLAKGEKAIIALSRESVRITPEWLSLRGLGEYAQVSERTLRGWIHSGVDPLPAVKIRGKVLVRRQQFDSWVERHKIQSLEGAQIDSIVKEIVEGVTS